jgi:hypothetical protein
MMYGDMQGPGGPQRDGYYDSQPQGYGYGYQPPNNGYRRGYPNRMASEPSYNTSYRQQTAKVYPSAENHRSYETVASGSGSGSGMSAEPAGYQTDPTSDNSSIDRRQSPPKPLNDYGISFNQSTNPPVTAFTVGLRRPDGPGQPPNAGYQPNARPQIASAPPVPQKDAGARFSVIQRKPTATSTLAQAQRPVVEKRQSWFGRHFGKKN